MIAQMTLTQTTRGRGTYEITDEVAEAVHASGIGTGICHIFVHHTSASLILCENADARVRSDLDAFLTRLIPDGDKLFDHTTEGPDDMPAHVRAVLTNMELTVPITGGRCALGTWQGIFLYEHRTHPHRRHITVTASGEQCP